MLTKKNVSAVYSFNVLHLPLFLLLLPLIMLFLLLLYVAVIATYILCLDSPNAANDNAILGHVLWVGVFQSPC